MVPGFHCILGARVGLCGKIVQGVKHGAVNGSGIVKEFSSDLLKEVSLGLRHWFGEVKISHLLFLAVIWWDVLGWCSIVPGEVWCWNWRRAFLT